MLIRILGNKSESLGFSGLKAPNFRGMQCLSYSFTETVLLHLIETTNRYDDNGDALLSPDDTHVLLSGVSTSAIDGSDFKYV